MSLLSTRKFTAEAVNTSEPISRATRRIIINAEILKQAKVYAGDVVGLSAADSHKVHTVPSLSGEDPQMTSRRTHEPTDQACSPFLGIRSGRRMALVRAIPRL